MDRRTLLNGMANLTLAGLTQRTLISARPNITGPPSAAQATGLLPSSTTVSASGAWCWFGDPRAVHFVGERSRTYVGYITAAGQIAVSQYDHVTGALTSSVVYVRTPGDPTVTVDDHACPSIVIRPDRRVVLFWSGHAGPVMYYRRSARPEDISAWEPLKKVPVNSPGSYGYTYPNPVQLPAEPGKLYLFFRGGSFNPTFTTTVGGDRWTDAQTLISVPGQRPYLKVATNGTDMLHFAFTDGHPRNVNTSIYYMYYHQGNLYRPGRRLIGPLGVPIEPRQAEKVYDAVDNPTGRAWVHDIAVGADNRPVLTYATFPTPTDHRYRYARWTGTSWFDRELCTAGDSISEDPAEPNYSGGITLDADDPTVVLMSRQIGPVNEIERWSTGDGGRTWSREALTSQSTQTNVRPISPRGLNGQGRFSAIWMNGRYPSYTAFQTRILTL